MKDLHSLLAHPSVAGFDSLMLASGRPITLVKGGEKKALGGALTSAQLHALLKASFAEELLADFSWGKELSAGLDGPGGHSAVRIQLRPDKLIVVEIAAPTAAAAPTPAAPTPAAAPAASSPAPRDDDDTVSGGADEDPEIGAEIVRLSDAPDTALLYVPRGDPAPWCAVVEQLGYPPRVGRRAAAVQEVLTYHGYPLCLLVLDGDFRDDPVYRFLARAPMDQRRTQFSILAAPGLDTGNTLLAFTLSMHYTAALDRAAGLAPLLEDAVTQWKRYTAPLHDYLQQAGRL